MNVCIIPARGGSKRIPDKNIRPFCGKPIIAYSIEAAKRAAVFDRIIVSTDSRKIARISKEWGAEVPFIRPPELSDDHTATDAVILHALEFLKGSGENPEYACCLYATAPFSSPEHITEGLNILRSSSSSSAFSVTTFPFPILRALRINTKGYLEMIWPEHRLTRSQDLPESYHDAGQFYWVNVSKYMQSPHVYALDSKPVILPRHLVQDIDTEEDWHRAELMYKAQFL